MNLSLRGLSAQLKPDEIRIVFWHNDDPSMMQEWSKVITSETNYYDDILDLDLFLCQISIFVLNSVYLGQLGYSQHPTPHQSNMCGFDVSVRPNRNKRQSNKQKESKTKLGSWKFRKASEGKKGGRGRKGGWGEKADESGKAGQEQRVIITVSDSLSIVLMA